MTTLVSDAFTGVDNSSLDAHVPDVRPGANMWAEQIADWTLLSNHARVANSYRAHAVIDCGEATGIEVSVDAVANYPTGGSLYGTGVVLRWTTVDAYYRVVLNQVDDAVYLVERNGGVDTQRGSASLTIDIGTEYRLVAGLDGQTITAAVNGANVLSYSSAALNETATRHGVYICRSSSNGDYVDDFLVETVGGGGATGGLAVTLEGAALQAAGAAPARGELAATLAGATLQAAGTAGAPAAASGSLAVTLAGASLSAGGTAPARGWLAATLAGASLQATGLARSLTATPTPAERMTTVEGEARVMVQAFEARVMRLPAESRVCEVEDGSKL